MEVFLEIIEYIVLGLIQGVTEVLPISSSGHVTFAQEMFNTDIDNSVFFLIVLNLGSIISIIYYLRKDLKVYFTDFYLYVFRKNREKSVKKNFCYLRNVFYGILPIMIIGFFVSYFIQDIYDANSLIFIGVGALMTATILFAVYRYYASVCTFSWVKQTRCSHCSGSPSKIIFRFSFKVCFYDVDTNLLCFHFLFVGNVKF